MNLRIAQFRLLIVLLALFVGILAAQPAFAAAPCCSITGINTQTGLVTAKVNATGQTFQFTLSNRAQVAQLRVGQGIYANLTAKQVSLDGRTVAGTITAMTPAGGTTGPKPIAPPNSTGSAPSGSGSQNAGSQPITAVNVANTAAQNLASALPDFSIAFAPNSQTTAMVGTNVSYTINISRSGNFNGPLTLSTKVNGTANPSFAILSSTSVTLGCSASQSSAVLKAANLNCDNAATATLTVPAIMNGTPPAPPSPGGPEIIEVDATYTPSVSLPVLTSTRVHSAQITLTNIAPAPKTGSCGGTSNPLSADTCGHSAAVATNVFDASCGASATITGNIFPAGSDDWLAFTVPASHANCTNPLIHVTISSSPLESNIFFDALMSDGVTAVFASSCGECPSYSGGPAAPVGGFADLGSVHQLVKPGTYFIRIHAAKPGAVGTWTITLKS